MTIKLQRLSWSALDAAARKDALTRPAMRANPEISARVEEIMQRVRREDDAALLALAREIDGVELDVLAVGPDEVAYAEGQLTLEQIAAIDTAIANVRRFHAAQLREPLQVETSPGVICERVTRPIGAVGLYVPAGSAPLPSTAIMLAVPAALADCPTRIVCTPPRPDGRADPAVVVAARRCGIERIFKVGGAQAIAAMAYGTETIPKVDKIFGPGNAWVTAAKKAAAADPDGAALDMPAGPSEVMVIADASAEPAFVALDLMAQAEHGPDSQAMLVCTDPAIADAVEREINAALPALNRREIISQSLPHGAALIVDNLDQAFDVANQYAPEHLIIQINKAEQYIDLIINAGSVFVGPWTPESLGDYCSGTNHVLPTYGFARAYSGLSVVDFQRSMTLQRATRSGLEKLARTVEVLAGMEGLGAHAEAVSVRIAAGRKRTVA